MIDRSILSFFSGALIYLSGTLVQGLTQNALASPATLGMMAISVMLVLLGYLGMHFFELESLNQDSIAFISFGLSVLFSLAPYFYYLKRYATVKIYGNLVKTPIHSLLILGMCINLFIGSFYSLMQFIFQIKGLFFPTELWFGQFRSQNFVQGSFFIFLGTSLYALAFSLRKPFEALSLGSELVLSWGEDLRELELKFFLLSFWTQALVTSFFGVFSFMGLILPHVIREIPFFRYSFSREIIFGPILAGVLFYILDRACYEFPIWGAEIPVGLLSSLIGTFLLILTLVRKPS